MARKLCSYVILVSFTAVLAKDPEPELPPCPTNFQFLPQTLPMHCKMTSQPFQPPPLPPQFPPFMPGPPENPGNPVPSPQKPLPAPFPPQMPMGMPPMPMGMPPMPMGMSPPLPMGPMPMGLPGMPMGMPMLGGPPQAKLPVIVMPFYSPDPAYKDPRKDPRKPSEPYKRKVKIIKKSHHHHDSDDSDSETDTSSSSDTDSSDSDRKRWTWKNRRSMRRHKKIRHARKRDYLTPVLQYVSKDGYVVFEKSISKNEAKDWLGDNKGPNEETGNADRAQETNNKYVRVADEARLHNNVNTRDLSREADDKDVNKNIQRLQRKARQKEIQQVMKHKQQQ
ncbi:cleavage and polyadenylation specificity factor subunit 6-like [Cydia amplana]|uniref:cleavage and polyadenylation specificity factor subunit 6-like n=1 Tax=Cydia amplana TaxID=1869771 RepID=UPI002FE5CAA9